MFHGKDDDSSKPPLIRGYLKKRFSEKGPNARWKLRYFAQTDDVLLYYPDKKSNKAKGKIDLSKVTDIRRSDKVPKGFDLVTAKRVYHLQVPENGERTKKKEKKKDKNAGAFGVIADPEPTVSEWIEKFDAWLSYFRMIREKKMENVSPIEKTIMACAPVLASFPAGSAFGSLRGRASVSVPSNNHQPSNRTAPEEGTTASSMTSEEMSELSSSVTDSPASTPPSESPLSQRPQQQPETKPTEGTTPTTSTTSTTDSASNSTTVTSPPPTASTTPAPATNTSTTPATTPATTRTTQSSSLPRASVTYTREEVAPLSATPPSSATVPSYRYSTAYSVDRSSYEVSRGAGRERVRDREREWEEERLKERERDREWEEMQKERERHRLRKEEEDKQRMEQAERERRERDAEQERKEKEKQEEREREKERDRQRQKEREAEKDRLSTLQPTTPTTPTLNSVPAPIPNTLQNQHQTSSTTTTTQQQQPQPPKDLLENPVAIGGVVGFFVFLVLFLLWQLSVWAFVLGLVLVVAAGGGAYYVDKKVQTLKKKLL